MSGHKILRGIGIFKVWPRCQRQLSLWNCHTYQQLQLKQLPCCHLPLPLFSLGVLGGASLVALGAAILVVLGAAILVVLGAAILVVLGAATLGELGAATLIVFGAAILDD
jgi:hypothetical protein